jgi:hypothetical protein
MVSFEFSLTYFLLHYGPGVDSAFNRSEYQEYFLGRKGKRCVGLTSLPPSCADYLEIWESQPPGTLGPVQFSRGITLPDNCWLFEAVEGLQGIVCSLP